MNQYSEHKYSDQNNGSAMCYPRVLLLLFILAAYGISLDISASTEMVTPYQCQTSQKQTKALQHQQDETYTEAYEHPVTDEDCWFEIAKEIDADG